VSSLVSTNFTVTDRRYLAMAVRLALQAEKQGNLPIGAVITLSNRVIATGSNSIFVPTYHPGRHAEMLALQAVAPNYWLQAGALTCYTTLEPCLMCSGALLLHGVGRVVFGAADLQGGAGYLRHQLPAFYQNCPHLPDWIGPVWPALCDPLYQRAVERFGNGRPRRPNKQPLDLESGIIAKCKHTLESESC
jgi:tRNA(adenine34) deaminase